VGSTPSIGTMAEHHFDPLTISKRNRRPYFP
jgi:hypothetical protein